MVITTTDSPLVQSEWSAMTTVLPALHSNSFYNTRSEYQGVSFSVPLIMLAPSLMWPVGQLSTRAQHMPLFGQPWTIARLYYKFEDGIHFPLDLALIH